MGNNIVWDTNKPVNFRPKYLFLIYPFLLYKYNNIIIKIEIVSNISTWFASVA